MAACAPDPCEDLGLCTGPEDVYLALRGLRTLSVRLERHQRSGLELANWLKRRPEVARVIHPGLPGRSLPCDLEARLQRCFRLVRVRAETRGAHKALAAMLDDLKLFGMGYSWGGFEKF